MCGLGYKDLLLWLSMFYFDLIEKNDGILIMW